MFFAVSIDWFFFNPSYFFRKNTSYKICSCDSTWAESLQHPQLQFTKILFKSLLIPRVVILYIPSTLKLTAVFGFLNVWISLSKHSLSSTFRFRCVRTRRIAHSTYQCKWPLLFLYLPFIIFHLLLLSPCSLVLCQ